MDSRSSPTRGRSRFSKALPTPPVISAKAENMTSPIKTSTSKSALPPLPKDATRAPITIPRRPIGGSVRPVRPVRPVSIESVSSVYSESPGLSRSLSGSSTKDSLSGFDSDDGTQPTFSLEDNKENEMQGGEPHIAQNISPNTISRLNSSPQQRVEIWKRRPAKNDRRVVFPELKLAKSNGSTASPPKRQEQPSERPLLPRSLSGRKAIPARPAPPQPDLMGNKLTKLKTKGSSANSSNDEVPTPQVAPSQGSSVQQPSILSGPNNDRQKSGISAVVSPVSPVSPFTPSSGRPPLIPRKSTSRSQASSNATIVPTVKPTSPTLLEANNKENLNMGHARAISDALTITSDTTIMPAHKPHGPIDIAQILTPKASPDLLQGVVNSSRFGGLYFFENHPRALPGTVFPAPPLALSHLECYQSHKHMRSSPNKHYHVACMVCHSKDMNARWTCSWCCLSACGNCMNALSSIPEKDLRVCLERIGK